MKYTTVFLDFDDTLIDTQGNSKKFLHETYEEQNINQYYPTFEEFFDDYFPHKHQRTPQMLAKNV